MEKVVYPIYISYEPDGTECDYLVYIPDLDGYTQGRTIAECIDMARDFIGNYLIEVPDAPLPDSIAYSPDDKALKTLVDVDLDLFKMTLDNTPVKKTLSIPRYLNDLGNKANINFSQTLTEALKTKLGV